MPQNTIKTQISNQYLSISGIGFINNQFFLETFGIKPEQVSRCILDIGLAYQPDGVVLIGDNSWTTTYLSGAVISRLWQDPLHAHLFDRVVFNSVMASLMQPDLLPSLERITSGIITEQGLSSVPPMIKMSEVL